MEKSYVNAGMPEKSYSGIGISSNSQLSQSGISLPHQGSVRYRWSRISPALPSYSYELLVAFSFEWTVA
jgi:hypothetical protein